VGFGPAFALLRQAGGVGGYVFTLGSKERFGLALSVEQFFVKCDGDIVGGLIIYIPEAGKGIAAAGL
jgi:hypothetical protein